MNENEQAVYDCIKKLKPARQSEIVEHTKLSASVVHYALKVLVGTGKIDYRPARYEVRK